MECDKLYMDTLSITFNQDGDCTQKLDDMQSIEVHLESNGSGRFIWFKTDRWSISDVEDLQKIIDRVRALEKLNDEYEK